MDGEWLLFWRVTSKHFWFWWNFVISTSPAVTKSSYSKSLKNLVYRKKKYVIVLKIEHWMANSVDSDQSDLGLQSLSVCTKLCVENLHVASLHFCNEASLHYCNDPKFLDRQVWTNSVDPDQTTPTNRNAHYISLYKKGVFYCGCTCTFALLTWSYHWVMVGKVKIGIIAISLQIFWQKFCRDVPCLVLYQTYHFSPNTSICLVG